MEELILTLGLECAVYKSSLLRVTGSQVPWQKTDLFLLLSVVLSPIFLVNYMGVVSKGPFKLLC